jgi:hypothetical protein
MKNLIKIVSSLVLMAFVAVFFSAVFNDPSLIVPVMGLLFAIGFAKGLLKIEARSVTGVLYDGFVITDTTYAGEAASSFIVKAITGNETIQGGHVYVKDGIKKAFTIPRWDADFEDFVQDRAATPVSKGTMTVDGRALTPADYMIYTEFNPRDYEAHWFATQLNPTLIDRALPPTVESIVVQEVLKRHDRYLNKALWNSNTTLTNIYKYYNGFIRKAQLANSGTDQTVIITATTLTAANIQAEMLKCYNAIPAALRYNKDMKFFMSYATYDLYVTSQINQLYKGKDITSEGVGTFKGRECIHINDFPDNCFYVAKGNATPESNLWVGMNSTDDAKLEMRPVSNPSELWYIKMLMKVDVQVGWASETVLYI